MSHKTFDNDLVIYRKRKVTLTVSKPAYVGMRILDLSKVLIYKFHNDYIKKDMELTQGYYSHTLRV